VLAKVAYPSPDKFSCPFRRRETVADYFQELVTVLIEKILFAYDEMAGQRIATEGSCTI
jgi:hypothetical protein